MFPVKLDEVHWNVMEVDRAHKKIRIFDSSQRAFGGRHGEEAKIGLEIVLWVDRLESLAQREY